MDSEIPSDSAGVEPKFWSKIWFPIEMIEEYFKLQFCDFLKFDTKKVLHENEFLLKLTTSLTYHSTSNEI